MKNVRQEVRVVERCFCIMCGRERIFDGNIKCLHCRIKTNVVLKGVRNDKR